MSRFASENVVTLRSANSVLDLECRSDCHEYRTKVSRRYLGRALDLGFREIGFARNGGPVLAYDDARRFVWMGLGDEGAIQDSEPQHRIESAPYRPQTSPRRRSTLALPA